MKCAESGTGEDASLLEGLGDLKGDFYLNEDLVRLLVQRLEVDGDAVTYVGLTWGPTRFACESTRRGDIRSRPLRFGPNRG